jgi:hypothetical protein
MRFARTPLLLASALALLAACNRNESIIPSCLPPGYQPTMAVAAPPRAPMEQRGEELDVKLAVVEGEVITRRRLVREVGGLAAGQDPETLERQIQARLLQRARLLVFAREAQRAGVAIRDQLLETVVDEELERRTELAAETIGEPVTVVEYLAEQGLTLDEFRQRVKEELLFKAYVIRLQQGLGGPLRPQVDMEVAPAEVRRIYWSHPGAFDEKPAVRFAAFQFLVEDYLIDDEISPLDAEEKALEDAAALKASFAKGVDPKELAERFDISLWNASKEGDFAEEGGPIRKLGEEANVWLFSPETKAGDAVVHAVADGPAVLGLIERRQGRRIPYDEAYDKIVSVIQKIREVRIVEQRLIEILSTRDTVEPPELAARLLAESRASLAKIDSDPVLAAARFR